MTKGQRSLKCPAIIVKMIKLLPNNYRSLNNKDLRVIVQKWAVIKGWTDGHHHLPILYMYHIGGCINRISNSLISLILYTASTMLYQHILESKIMSVINSQLLLTREWNHWVMILECSVSAGWQTGMCFCSALGPVKLD